LILSALSSELFAAFINRPAAVVGLGFNASSLTCATENRDWRKSPFAFAATAVSAASRFSRAFAYAAAMTSSGVIKTAAEGAVSNSIARADADANPNLCRSTNRSRGNSVAKASSSADRKKSASASASAAAIGVLS